MTSLERSPQNSKTDRSPYPVYAEALPTETMAAGQYYLRFATSAADLQAIQRLRFEVFNLELNEGLESAYDLGRDEDEFDATCHHLMVISKATDSVVGTYRLMLNPMAVARGGFYSETEFDFSTMPSEVLERGLEVGRACVAAEHRNGRVINLLWRGLARYLTWNDKRYLFGCCSVPTLDETIGANLYANLAAQGHVHSDVVVQPLPALVSNGVADDSTEDLELPPLFQSYLRLGTKVVSPPAIDRQFKVTDFLVVLDLAQLDERVRKTFFGSKKWKPDER